MQSHSTVNGDISAESESGLINSDNHELSDAVCQHNQSPKLSKKLKEKLCCRSRTKCEWLEIGCLVAVLAVVWALLSLPVIFYHLPQIQVCI